MAPWPHGEANWGNRWGKRRVPAYETRTRAVSALLVTTLGGRYLVFSLEQIGATVGVSGGGIPPTA